MNTPLLSIEDVLRKIHELALPQESDKHTPDTLLVPAYQSRLKIIEDYTAGFLQKPPAPAVPSSCAREGNHGRTTNR